MLIVNDLHCSISTLIGVVLYATKYLNLNQIFDHCSLWRLPSAY